ncbi:MAG: septal ring lytic transglycosylase RlpA family protein [Xenococcaceae cyanobacterium]
MHQLFWSGITTALLTTAVGTTVSIHGSSSASTLSTPQPKEVVKLGENQSQTATESEENLIATIHPHQWEELTAATLYIRSIPVLTFLGSPTASAGDTKEIVESKDKRATDANQSQDDPMSRAKTVASRLNQLSRENFDPEGITVSWNFESKSYSIKVNDEELVRVDKTTILPDTTNNVAQDALQATNRLRRLMGNAPPLPEIASKPKPKPTSQVAQGGVKRQIRGMASWYGPGFNGRRTASGERFNQNALTAAHRSLPFGTKVRVTNMNNGRSVIVRINDRGPHSRGRLIDLSAAAARVIGLIHSGVAPVRVEVLGR